MHDARARKIPYTLDLVREEARLCREMEELLLGEGSKIKKMLLENRTLSKITNGEAKQDDPLSPGQPGRILIELTSKTDSLAALDLSAERRAVRGMFGGLNRVGIAVATGHACVRTVAMCEGRYFAAAWFRWKPYVAYRRDRGFGRERVYAPAESLMHAIACTMLENLSTSQNGHRFWEALQNGTEPLSEYYRFDGFATGE